MESPYMEDVCFQMLDSWEQAMGKAVIFVLCLIRDIWLNAIGTGILDWMDLDLILPCIYWMSLTHTSQTTDKTKIFFLIKAYVFIEETGSWRSTANTLLLKVPNMYKEWSRTQVDTKFGKKWNLTITCKCNSKEWVYHMQSKCSMYVSLSLSLFL